MHTRLIAALAAVALCATALSLTPAAAQRRAKGAEKLGTIHFPNSGGAAAQAGFLRGMKLYWSFEYENAATAFRDAQRHDPTFALAFMGEALTYTHQVWGEQDLAAGRAVLARLGPTAAVRAAKAPTARERMYLALAEVLYGDGSKARRDTLFAGAAAQLLEAYPSDDEARTFRALGLLGLSQGVREYGAYMQAGALAADVLRRHPDHPGAAHFVIHAFDDPVHAPLGLWAARRYSEIAPAAPHALHMTSHIFLAMGLWDDVIDVNRRAVASVVAARRRAGLSARGCGHYGEWLHYGYLQAGRVAEAEAVVRGCMPAPPRDSLVDGMEGSSWMRAAHVTDAPPVQLPPMITTPRTSVDAYGYWHYGSGLAAIAADDRVGARDALTHLATPLPAGIDPGTALRRRAFTVELRALLGDAGLEELDVLARELDARPVEFGPPDVSKPVRELRAELLLATGRAAEAQQEFDRALAAFPGRSRALLGLARAALAAGDSAAARRATARLARNWRGADRTFPALSALQDLQRALR